MSTQIAVRLPDELVEFLDHLVEEGHARSRAAVVAQALARERRRLIALNDARILSRVGGDPELESLARYASGIALDLE